MDNVFSFGQLLNLLAKHLLPREKIWEALKISQTHFSRICNNKVRIPNKTSLHDFVIALNSLFIELDWDDAALIKLYQETIDLAAATPYLSEPDRKAIESAVNALSRHKDDVNDQAVTKAGFSAFLKQMFDISCRYPNELADILKKQQEYEDKTKPKSKSHNTWADFEKPAEQTILYDRMLNYKIKPGSQYLIRSSEEDLKANLSIIYEISNQALDFSNLTGAYKDAYAARQEAFQALFSILREHSGLAKSTSDSTITRYYGTSYYPGHPYEKLNQSGLAKIKYHPLLDFYKDHHQQYYKINDFRWYQIDAPEWIPTELRASIDSYRAHELPALYNDLQSDATLTEAALSRQRVDRIFYKEDQFHVHISQMNYLHNNIYMGLNQQNAYFHNKYVLSRFPEKMEMLTHQYPCAMNGCGLILQTLDNYLAFTFRPDSVVGNQIPSRFSYACNGSCRHIASSTVSSADPDNQASPSITNPFESILQEAAEELNVKLSIEDLNLMGLGIDLERFYIQWTFFVKSNLTAAQICQCKQEAEDNGTLKNHGKQLFFVPYNINSIAFLLERFDWEPACEFSLIQFTHMKSMTENWRLDAQIPVISPSLPEKERSRSSE